MRSAKTRILAMLMLAVVLASSCLPQYPMVYIVLDQTGSSQQGVHSGLLGHRDFSYGFNLHMDQGIRSGPFTTSKGPTAMIDRISSDVVAQKPSMVLIQATMADTSDPAVYNDYASVIDQLMTKPGMGTVPVAWMSPLQENLVAPYTIEGAEAINIALQAAEARYPKLWAVPTQQVWNDAWGQGKCPVKIGYQNWQMRPIAECYANYGQTVDLAGPGMIASSTLNDAIMRTQLVLKQPRDEAALVTMVHQNQN